MRVIRLLAIAGTCGILAACSYFGIGGGTSATTLAQAQAEASVILSAIQSAAQVYETSPQATPATTAQINSALSGLQSAVNAFQGVDPSNAIAVAEAAGKAAMGVVAVIPMDATTKTDVMLGIAVLEAFAAALPPPAPVNPAPVAPVVAKMSLKGEAASTPPPIPIHAR